MKEYIITYEYHGKVKVKVSAVDEIDAQINGTPIADEKVKESLSICSIDVREVKENGD
jgi:hypothetical protein